MSFFEYETSEIIPSLTIPMCPKCLKNTCWTTIVTKTEYTNIYCWNCKYTPNGEFLENLIKKLKDCNHNFGYRQQFSSLPVHSCHKCYYSITDPFDKYKDMN